VFLPICTRRPAPIQQVVGHLERDAQPVAIPRRAPTPAPAARDHAADLAGRLEQCCGLAADHLEVDVFGRREVHGRRQLQHLALGDRRGGVRQDVEHAQVLRFDHQLERAREQVVAHQHAGLVVPQQVRRGPPAPPLAFVDHVVVQKRRGVDELHRRGEFPVILALVTAKPRAASVSIGRMRLPPASTRCAVTSGMRGACSDAMRSRISAPVASRSPASAACIRSCGLVLASSRLMPRPFGCLDKR
jgi:hypothetical protein